MTPEEEKEVIRVCGKNYEETDIPTYIRNKDKKVAEYQSWTFMKLAEAFGLPKHYAKKYNPWRKK